MAHGACSLINVKCLKLIGGYDEKFRVKMGLICGSDLYRNIKLKT